MKRILLLSLLIISCNTVTAPNDVHINREYYESGELKRIIIHNNENLTSEMTVYYKDGVLMGKGSMINNKFCFVTHSLVGTFKIYIGNVGAYFKCLTAVGYIGF